MSDNKIVKSDELDPILTVNTDSHSKVVIALIYGVISCITSCINSIAGLVFGIVGIIKSNKAKKLGNTEEIRNAGFILSCIGIIISCITFIIKIIS